MCIHLDPDALHEGTLWEDRVPQIPSRFLGPEPLTPTLQGPRSMDQLKLLMLASYCACETGCMTLSTLDVRNSSSLRYSSKARRCWQPARRAHVAICGGVSQNWGKILGGSYNKDCSFGLHWGPPVLGKYHITCLGLREVTLESLWAPSNYHVGAWTLLGSLAIQLPELCF